MITRTHSLPLIGVLLLAVTHASTPSYAENPVFEPADSSPIIFGSSFLGYGYSVVTAADMNVDGNLDVVMTRLGSNSVDILHGNGDGTFEDAISIFVGGHPVSVVADDFNEDGQPDFACTNGDLGTVTVFLSTLTGFVTGGSMVTGSRPVRLVSQDLNEDGHRDLLVVDQIDSTVGLLVGDGLGGFGSLQTSFIEIDDSLEAITVEDLDDDGHLDLIVPCPLQDLVAVLIGVGDGEFLDAVMYDVGDNPGFVAVSDYDGDGIKDVAANNRDGDSVSLLRGVGFGLLEAYQEIPIGDNPTLVRTLDTSGTGEQDLAVTIAGDDALRIQWGLSATSHGYSATINLGYSPDFLITGDFDGDALDDIVIVDKGEGLPHGTVQLYLNRTTAPTFRRGDVDGNGVIEVDDAMALLEILFNGATDSCPDSGDFGDDGAVNISDAVALLAHVFQSLPGPAEPSACGVDPVADDLPTCDAACL